MLRAVNTLVKPESQLDSRYPCPVQTIVTASDRIQHFVASDGVQLGCHVGGQGSPLLLVHGTAADASRWKPVLPGLQNRFTTYALDRRGRGASGDAADWSFDREVADIRTVVEGIGGPVDVIGHSMGGALAMEAAVTTPAIRRLVLYEPALVGMPAGFLDAILPRLRSLLAAGDRDALVQTFMREVAGVPEDQLQVLRTLPAWPGRLAAAHTLIRELEAGRSYRFEPNRTSQITATTLLLVGGASSDGVKAGVEQVHQTIKGSSVAVLSGQKHVAMDTAPQLFLDAVLGFLI